jgi:hypothetical protein
MTVPTTLNVNGDGYLGGTLYLDSGATIKFGGGADADLYRQAANQLATDGALIGWSGLWSGGLIKSYGTGTDRTPAATGIVTSATTITNDATEEVVLGYNAVPANEPVAGALYQGSMFGVLDTTASSPTLQVRLLWGGGGGVQLISGTTPALGSSAAAHWPWQVEFWLQFVSTTSAYCSLNFDYPTGPTATTRLTLSSPGAVTLVTSANEVLEATFKWSAASASNTWTIQGGAISRVA